MRLMVAPSSGLIDGLIAGSIDVAVCVEPPSPVRGIDTAPLLVEDLAVYGPDQVVEQPPTQWGPWVLFPEGSHTRSIIVDALIELNAPIDVVAESHQPDVLREMVGLGLGWTVLPTVQGEGPGPRLARGATVASRQLVMAKRDGAATSPAIDFLDRALRG